MSSRVGRSKDKPGLVVVLYGQSKPRDRSHYERFRSYHQKLYAGRTYQCYPLQQAGNRAGNSGNYCCHYPAAGFPESRGASPRPFPLTTGSRLLTILEDMLRERCKVVTDGEDTKAVPDLLAERLRQWRKWDPSDYGVLGFFGEPGADVPSGSKPSC